MRINMQPLRDMPIEEILKKAIKTRLSVKTVNMRLIDAATLFNWAVAKNIDGIMVNVFKNIDRFNSEEHKKRP